MSLQSSFSRLWKADSSRKGTINSYAKFLTKLKIAVLASFRVVSVK